MDIWLSALHVGLSHGVHIVLETLPSWICNHGQAAAIMQQTWDRSWKHTVLSSLLPFWSQRADVLMIDKLPKALESFAAILLKQDQLKNVWVFDTNRFSMNDSSIPLPQFQATAYAQPAPLRTKGTNEAIFGSVANDSSETSGTLKTANHKTTTSPSPPTSQSVVHPLRLQETNRRVVFLYTSTGEGLITPLCMNIGEGNGTQTVIANTDCATAVAFYPAAIQTASDIGMQVMGLQVALLAIQEVHAVYVKAVAAHIAQTIQTSIGMLGLQTHPLISVLEHLVQKLHNMSDEGDHGTCLPSHRLPTLSRRQGAFVWNEQYLDIRQRTILQGGQQDISFSRLEAKRNHANAFYTKESTRNRSIYSSMYQVYHTMKERHAFVDEGAQRKFHKRCWTEEEVVKLFSRASLTTDENVKLTKWADYIQTELSIRSNFTQRLSDWPYRAVCLLSDLICFVCFQKEQVAQLDPAVWREASGDNALSALVRIHDWITLKRLVDVDAASVDTFAVLQAAVERACQLRTTSTK